MIGVSHSQVRGEICSSSTCNSAESPAFMPVRSSSIMSPGESMTHDPPSRTWGASGKTCHNAVRTKGQPPLRDMIFLPSTLRLKQVHRYIRIDYASGWCACRQIPGHDMRDPTLTSGQMPRSIEYSALRIRLDQ